MSSVHLQIRARLILKTKRRAKKYNLTKWKNVSDNGMACLCCGLLGDYLKWHKTT